MLYDYTQVSTIEKNLNTLRSDRQKILESKGMALETPELDHSILKLSLALTLVNTFGPDWVTEPQECLGGLSADEMLSQNNLLPLEAFLFEGE